MSNNNDRWWVVKIGSETILHEPPDSHQMEYEPMMLHHMDNMSMKKQNMWGKASSWSQNLSQESMLSDLVQERLVSKGSKHKH